MGYLSDVQIPGGTPNAAPVAPTPSQPKGNFLSSVKLPTATQTAKSARLSTVSGAAQVAQANADYANSFTGKATNFIKGLPEATGISEQFREGVAQSQDQTPGAVGTLHRLSGVATALSAPLAPLINPVSRTISFATDKLENVPAYQKFASSLPNLPYGTMGQVAGDIGNIAGLAGGAAEAFKPRVSGGFLDKVKVPEKPSETKVPVTSSGEESKIKVNTPTTRHAEYSQRMGYEPYTPHDKLPVIQTGPKTESGLPIIQTETSPSKPVRGDFKIEPIKETSAAPTKNTPAPPTAPRTMSATHYNPETPSQGAKFTPLEPAESSGREVQNTLAKSISEGLKTELEDLPTHNQVNWDEQGELWDSMLKSDPDRVMRIADGKELPPNNMLINGAPMALEKLALKNGDGDLVYRILNSPIEKQNVRFGQEIGYLSQRDETSPVRAGREVQRARSGRATPQRVRDTVGDIRRTIRQTAPTKDDWEGFINDIKCGY